MNELEIPESWAETSLDHFVKQMDYGSSSKTNDDVNGVPVLRMGNILDGELVLNSLKFLPEKHPDFPKLLLSSNDILFNRTNSPELVGKTAVYGGEPEKCSFASYLIRVRLKKDYVPQLLSLFINSSFGKEWIASVLTKQTGQANVNGTKLKALNIPVPPYKEQHRIVTKIESCFTKIDATEKSLDKAAKLISLSRVSIFNEAFFGLDTAPLADLIREKPRNGYSPKAVDMVTGTKSLTLSATTSGVFDATKFKYIDETIPNESYLWLEPNDILIQRSNSLEHVGISAIYRGKHHMFIYPDLMMKLRATDEIDPEYLLMALHSPEVRQYFRSKASGAAGNMPKINQGIVMETPIPKCSKSDQTRVVSKVKKRLHLLGEIESQILTVKTQIAKAKKSILNQAFSGRLVPQFPEEGTGHELLQQILNTKAAEIEADQKPSRSIKPAPKGKKKNDQQRTAL